ncbi:MAG: hypothetical protein AAFY02_08685 [Pseudomonadota bacterium]
MPSKASILLPISWSAVLTAAALLFGSASGALADPSGTKAPGQPPDEDQWRFLAVPYVWFTNLTGNTTVRGISAPVDASFGGIASNLNIAVMGQFEVRKGKIGAFLNPVYASLEASNNAGPFQIGGQQVPSRDVTVSSTLFTSDVGLYYRVLELNFSGGPSAGGARVVAEPYIGARIWHLSTEISIPLRDRNFESSGNKTWADTIFGLRTQWDITDRWNVAAIGDVGGGPFGASDLTAQGILFAGYRFGLFNERDANLVAGYRALYDDFTTGSGREQFTYNATLHGPLLGLSIAF